MTKKQQRYNQLQTDIKAKRASMKALLDAGEAREDGAMTDDELKQYNPLKAEVKLMQDEAANLKIQIEDEAENETALKAFNTPQTPMIHQGGNGGDPDRKSTSIEFAAVGNLKNIKAHTKQEAETKAYRFGQFLLGGVFKHQPALDWCNANGIEIKAQNESINEQGGVLVPPEFDRMLIDLRETFGVFRRYTKMTPMASDLKYIPRRTSGVTAFWLSEGQAITDSSKGWDNVQLVAKKLAALVIYSNEISEDAIINLADDLAGEIAYAFANKEDEAGFNGDGSSTYGGIRGVRNRLSGVYSTTAGVGQVLGAGNLYSELTLANFNSVVGKLPQYADSTNAAWYCHKTFFHEVMEKLALAAGGVTAKEVQDGAAGPRPKFLGYPVNFSQVMPKTEANSQICTVFGDLAMASTMGDRRRTTLFSDPYSLSNQDQIRLRGTERIDINVHDVGDATNAGPVISLVTAAS